MSAARELFLEVPTWQVAAGDDAYDKLSRAAELWRKSGQDFSAGWRCWLLLTPPGANPIACWQLRNLDDAIARLERTIAKLAQKDETARRLMSISGFGPIAASAMAATIQDPSSFAGPRRVRRLSRTDPQAEFFGRQAETRAHFENGQSQLAQIARCRGARRAVSPQATHRPAADVGEEADREEALQACRRSACQQDGAHRLRDHARRDDLSRDSSVAGVGRVRGRAHQEPGQHRSRG